MKYEVRRCRNLDSLENFIAICNEGNYDIVGFTEGNDGLYTVIYKRPARV